MAKSVKRKEASNPPSRTAKQGARGAKIKPASKQAGVKAGPKRATAKPATAKPAVVKAAPKKAPPAKARASASRTKAATARAVKSTRSSDRDTIIDDLRRELEAARHRIVELEQRQDDVLNRLEWVLDTLKSAIQPVAAQRPRISRKSS